MNDVFLFRNFIPSHPKDCEDKANAIHDMCQNGDASSALRLLWHCFRCCGRQDAKYPNPNALDMAVVVLFLRDIQFR